VEDHLAGIDASGPLVVEDDLGPFGPGVGGDAVVALWSGFEPVQVETLEYMPPEETVSTRAGPSRSGPRSRAGRSSPVRRKGPSTWVATVSSVPPGVFSYCRLKAPALWMSRSRVSCCSR
jgi:hypothetical protein